MNLKIDLAQLRNIDFNDVGRWPVSVKVIAVAAICVAVLGAGLWLDTRTQMETLDSTRLKEQSLRKEFLEKQDKAANLDAYKAQMEEMKRSFGAMLRQLPSKTGSPSCWWISPRPACRPASSSSCSSPRASGRRIFTPSCR
jgi:type IV pilus assembly protein PilO